MERPVGSKFNCDGINLKVVAAESFCRGCYFHGKFIKRKMQCAIESTKAVIGECGTGRTDGKRVIFKRDMSKFG